MRYRFIEQHGKQFQGRAMCQTLQVSRSGYYAWQGRPESERGGENRRLLAEIEAIHKKSRGVYGSPRIHQELRQAGHTVSRGRVARLMQAAGISAKPKRKYRPTTDSKHDQPVAANRLDRRFEVAAPNRVWAGDITYIPTGEGWLYLSAVMDLHSRYIAGWSLQASLGAELATGALKMAYQRRRPGPGLLYHSDRGIQYASAVYRQLLADYGMEASMSRKGDVWDNAPLESFFSSLKRELIHRRKYPSREEAKREIFEYIEVFYNRQRLHSSLGYQSPAGFESKRAQTSPVY